MYNIKFYPMHFGQEPIEQALEQLAKESDLFNYNVFLFWLLGLVMQKLLIWEISTRDTKVSSFPYSQTRGQNNNNCKHHYLNFNF